MKHDADWRWFVAGLALLLAALALAAVGCHDRPAIAPTPTPAPIEAPSAPESVARTGSEAAQARVDRLEGELASAKLDAQAALAAEHRAEDRARMDGLRRVARWVAGIALLASFACVALAIMLPVGKQYAVGGGIAAGAVVALALATDRWLPLLPWIGAALALVGIAWGLWTLRRLVASTRESAAHGDRLEKVLTEVKQLVPPGIVDDLVGRAKALSHDAQLRAGAHGMIAAVRAKAKRLTSAP